jgi:hypothetical protein
VKWHNSNYDKRLPIQRNSVTDDPRVTLEATLPELTEYHDVFRTASVFVDREPPAYRGLDAKNVEVTRRNGCPMNSLWQPSPYQVVNKSG